MSGASYISTGKGPADHVLSVMLGRDCSMLRIFKRKPICEAPEDAPRAPVFVKKPVAFTRNSEAMYSIISR